MPSRPVRQQVEFDSRCPDQMGGAKKQEKTEIFVLSLVAKPTHDLHCHLILYLVNEKKVNFNIFNAIFYGQSLSQMNLVYRNFYVKCVGGFSCLNHTVNV